MKAWKKKRSAVERGSINKLSLPTFNKATKRGGGSEIGGEIREDQCKQESPNERQEGNGIVDSLFKGQGLLGDGERLRIWGGRRRRRTLGWVIGNRAERRSDAKGKGKSILNDDVEKKGELPLNLFTDKMNKKL